MEGNKMKRICIIGAGLSGICAAIRCLDLSSGHDVSVEILESNEDCGGVWYSHSSPGLVSDSAAYSYSYSFHRKLDWKSLFADRLDILSYIRDVVQKYELRPLMRFQHRVLSAVWDEKNCEWTTEIQDLKRNEIIWKKYNFIIKATGYYGKPKIPEQFLGFDGPRIHTANWPKEFDFRGKTVAVIGTGASGLQIIPEMAKVAEHVIVFQRTPGWIMPKPNMEFSSESLWNKALKNIPGLDKLVKMAFFHMYELFKAIYMDGTRSFKAATAILNWYRKRQLNGNEDLYAKLTPSYPLGCNILTVSSLYYPTLLKPNVQLVTSPISGILNGKTICTEDGNEYLPDVLILATGYEAPSYFSGMKVVGRNGVDIGRKWKSAEEGPSSYLGTVSKELPNFFMFVGPHALLTHNVPLESIEMQAEWIYKCLKSVFEAKLRGVVVKKEVELEFMKLMAEGMVGKTYNNVHCSSAWRDEEGRLVVPYPGTTYSFKKFVNSYSLSIMETI